MGKMIDKILDSDQTNNKELIEILNRWGTLGFLDGLESIKRANVANAFEIAAKALIIERDLTDRYREIETISFPILRRIFQTIETELEINAIETNVINILNKLVVNYTNYLTSNKDIEDLLKSANIDVEANFCAVFSENYKLEEIIK